MGLVLSSLEVWASSKPKTYGRVSFLKDQHWIGATWLGKYTCLLDLEGPKGGPR